MALAPLVRIFIRYVVGLVIGADAAGVLAGDPDLVTVGAALLGLLTEALYACARRRGWAT